MHLCIASYLQLCRPYQFSDPWGFCTVDECSMVGPSDPKTALMLLVEEYAEEQLATSGIMRLDSDGQWAFHSLLADPDVPFVLLFDTTTGKFRDLMTESGCLLGADIPMFEVLHDKRTSDAVGSEPSVFVTGTIADTILLRSFGLAAAPISGFCSLNQRGIEMLCEHYGFVRSPSDRELEEEHDGRPQQGESMTSDAPSIKSAAETLGVHGTKPPADSPAGPRLADYVRIGAKVTETQETDAFRLVFVRWCPSRMSSTEPESIQRAITELKSLQRHRRLEIDEVDQWIPLDPDLETIRFALARRESNWVSAAVLDCIFSGRGTLCHQKTAPTVVAPPTDVAGAVAALQEAMLGTVDAKSRQRRKEALHNYHRVIARRVTEPMLRQAQETSDPFDHALQLQFVHLNALFMETAPTVREQVLQGIIPRGGEGFKNGWDKSVSELLAISAQMVSIAKEMKTWKPRRTTTPRAPTSSKSAHSRRFADSDLAMKN